MTDTPRPIPPLDAGRADIVRAAADLIGREPLARELGTTRQAIYLWMRGERGVRDEVLDDIHKVIDHHLSALDKVARRIRAELSK